MYFQLYLELGYSLKPYEFICKSSFYIFHIFFDLIEIAQLELYAGSFKYPANIYLFKPNNRHARTRCGMYSELVTITPERRHSRRSGVFIFNFEHISHLFLMFLFLTWNK